MLCVVWLNPMLSSALCASFSLNTTCLLPPQRLKRTRGRFKSGLWSRSRSRGVGRIFNLRSRSRSRRKFWLLWLGQTFCSPIVTVCATNVTLANLSSLTLQQEMIMAIQTGGSALTCIPSLRGHSRSAASLGWSRNLHFVNATVRGLYHWNFHLLILAGTIVAPWRWLRNSEWEFSWELVHCYVTHVTEQW